MCGIVAQFFKDKAQINSNTTVKSLPFFERALDAISHRGKDATFINKYDQCIVGYRRLAITEIKGTPAWSGGWYVYLNGEIYNYKELGFEGSEVSVISQGLNKYGIDFVKRLNGMFFILVVKGDEVYVFRDRYGVKPVYYWETAEQIIVASEIKAILQHPDYKFGVNENAERQWLVFNNVFTDETLFKGIYKMDKGTAWHLNSGEKTKYWSWKFTPLKMDYNEAREEIRRLVIQAVQRQTPKEVKYGSSLSGGLDSNIILSSIPADIPTFTAGYAGQEDERQMAELASRDHYVRVFNRIRSLPETIYHLEDLRVGPSWQNYGLYELASKFVKVLFDGAGGDELFGGYPWRYEAESYYSVLNRTGMNDEYCINLFSKIFPEDTLAARYEFDANHFLEGVLLVVDKLSMAHTIEVRVPFLDNDLVDFAVQLPVEFKKRKSILRAAFFKNLPLEISAGAKKGFSTPDWYPGYGGIAKKWSEVALIEWFNIFASDKAKLYDPSSVKSNTPARYNLPKRNNG